MESGADSARVRENVVLLAVCGPGARLDFAAVDDNILRVIRAPEAGADACRVFAARSAWESFWRVSACIISRLDAIS